MSIWHLHSLPFNLPSLPSLSKRSIHRVDKDGNLVMEDDDLEGFRKSQESAVYGGFVDNWGQDKAELCEKAEY